MNKLPISVCMISGPEAHRIGASLQSVADWTSQIVVVLNQEVADGTDKIAAQYGARVCREPWKGHIDQKNSAAEKATQQWILGLDSDEIVSEQLRANITALFQNPGLDNYAAYNFPRCSFCCGRWIRHGDWYPDRSTRLWRKGKAKWGGINPHDKLIVEGGVGRLRGDLLHHTVESIDHLIGKIPRYSADFVQHSLSQQRSAGFLDLAVRPWWRFFRGYILRLGFLDGWQGYYIAWSIAFATATRYAKVKEARAMRNSNP